MFVCLMLQTVADDASKEHAGWAGFLFKYPSEGSNLWSNAPTFSSPKAVGGESSVDTSKVEMSLAALSYPIKCQLCQQAWVTNAKEMQAHRFICRQRVDHAGNLRESSVNFASFGVPRKMWFEVDFEQGLLRVSEVKWENET